MEEKNKSFQGFPVAASFTVRTVAEIQIVFLPRGKIVGNNSQLTVLSKILCASLRKSYGFLVRSLQ